ncbi:MAG: hypothetical protein HRU24_06670 [Gammaproteobacteria bacterium]|nr:hypothetical protein [Gammaproteobacteria bacterium]
MSSVSATNSGSGQQILTAALSKSLQEAEGKMALQLLEAAAATTQVMATPASSSANLGSHINIKA